MDIASLNILVGWIALLSGAAAGAALGLFFLLPGILVHAYHEHPFDVGTLGIRGPRVPGVIHPELEEHWQPTTASLGRHKGASA
jgi:hypothetical protein